MYRTLQNASSNSLSVGSLMLRSLVFKVDFSKKLFLCGMYAKFNVDSVKTVDFLRSLLVLKL